ncbi:MAG TPA: hypothetical protein VH092_15905 [Urbifossiella sp.]|nr:hypothetical protein [Urbifossiella sp.]
MGGREAEPRELGRAEVLSLPWPSAEQQAAFAAHVCWAHSWYKHLPLLAGAEFVVFLATDAGAGYSEVAPRLHYGWETTAEYRTRFGHLDYMWRPSPADRFGRDAAPAVRLPADLLGDARVTLFPFASSDFNAPDACTWGIHDDGFDRLRAGVPHPAGGLVLAWQDSRTALDTLWGGLTRDEQDLAVRLWRPQPEAVPEPLPPTVAEYLRLAALADSVYAGLQRAEEAKVLGAVGALAALLLRWAAEGSRPGPVEPVAGR